MVLERTNDARQVLVFGEQAMRGVCALAVILMHTTLEYPLGAPAGWSTTFLVYTSRLATFAVPIFVALAGFHLSLNERNERPIALYRRTLKPIIVPYVVYTVVYSAVLLVNVPSDSGWAAYPAGQRFVRALSWNLRHFSAKGHIWFIAALLSFYVLHPFLRRLYRRIGHDGLFLVIAFIGQLAWGTLDIVYRESIRHTEPGWLASLSLSSLPLIGYFVLGYYVRDHAAQILSLIRRPSARTVALVVWSATAGLLVAYWSVPALAVQYSIKGAHLAEVFLKPPLTIAASVLLLQRILRQRTTGTNRMSLFVQRCGLYAYGVYYLHPLVVDIAGLMLRAVIGLYPPSVAFAALEFPLSCFAVVAGVKCVARLPGSRYLV